MGHVCLLTWCGNPDALVIIQHVKDVLPFHSLVVNDTLLCDLYVSSELSVESDLLFGRNFI